MTKKKTANRVLEDLADESSDTESSMSSILDDRQANNPVLHTMSNVPPMLMLLTTAVPDFYTFPSNGTAAVTEESRQSATGPVYVNSPPHGAASIANSTHQNDPVHFASPPQGAASIANSTHQNDSVHFFSPPNSSSVFANITNSTPGYQTPPVARKLGNLNFNSPSSASKRSRTQANDETGEEDEASLVEQDEEKNPTGVQSAAWQWFQRKVITRSDKSRAVHARCLLCEKFDKELKNTTAMRQHLKVYILFVNYCNKLLFGNLEL
jgi:hypothetical protein